MSTKDKEITINNITEQELDELLRLKSELTDAKMQMERSNNILIAMFDAIPDLVFCKDLNGHYIECNKAFESFVQRTQDDILGKTFADLGNASPEAVESAGKVDLIVTSEGKTVKDDEVTLMFNETERYFEMIKTPLIESGETYGLLGIMHDVTDRHTLIKNLRDAQSHLEHALEQANSASTAKSEFLSRMSHELRTPMNAIMGMAQIAKASSDPIKIKNYVDEIYESSHHLMRLISNLLEVSGGISTLSESKFSLDSMLEYIKSRIIPILDKRRQILEVNIDNSVPQALVANEKRIAQVIIHLLTNASKFSDSNNTITLTFKITKETADEKTLEVAVKDTGIGMSEDTIHTIFDMFEQGDGSHTRKEGGVGIGLTLSRYIVEMMGGKITVESELDKGSVFTFTVQVKK